MHGVWHVDKGILFTIKELFTRPGHSVREYLEGKRIYFYNFISLILLLLAVSALLAPYIHVKMSDLMPQTNKEMMTSFEKFVEKYPKLILLIAVPVYSLFSFVWFRKAKLNYSEHLVLNSYRIIPELIVGLLFSAITIFYTNTKVLAVIYVLAVNLLLVTYSVWFYYQFFSKYNYTKGKLLFKSIMVPVSYLLLSFIIGIVFAFLNAKH